MSFILDALKKSESERQQQTGADFSDVPTRTPDEQSFKWLWLMAIILVINLVVLLGILLRPNSPGEAAAPPTQPAAAQPEPAQPVAAEPTFEEQVENARREQEASTAPGQSPPAARPAAAIEASPAPVEEPVAEPAASTPDRPYLKTIDELRLEGVLQLAELHLDIHVYAEEPAERFVFINMSKHGESSKLAEGPVVKEITTDGVILEHQGMTFLLPRE